MNDFKHTKFQMTFFFTLWQHAYHRIQLYYFGDNILMHSDLYHIILDFECTDYKSECGSIFPKSRSKPNAIIPYMYTTFK